MSNDRQPVMVNGRLFLGLFAIGSVFLYSVYSRRADAAYVSATIVDGHAYKPAVTPEANTPASPSDRSNPALRVVLNSRSPMDVPAFVRTVNQEWSAPMEINSGTEDSPRAYIGVGTISGLLKARPRGNFWASSFGVVVLKDYRVPQASDAILQNLTGADAERFRFIEEAALIDTVSLTYTVVARKYIDRDGVCFLTSPEGFRERSSIDVNDSEADEVASRVASGIVHALSDEQRIALEAIGLH
jgi:hypothetical protein